MKSTNEKQAGNGDRKTYSLWTAPSKYSRHWGETVWTDLTLDKRFSYHEPRAQKDGEVFAPCRLDGRRRKKKNVKSVEFAVYDVDDKQTFDEGMAGVKALGLRAWGYTSYSHLTDTTLIGYRHFARWASEEGRSTAPDQASIVDYLKSCGKEHLSNVKFVGIEGSAPELSIRITHDPVHKFRVVVPLAEPFDVAKYGVDAWRRQYIAIGRALGLKFDEACSDVTRCFYFPSRPIDAVEGRYAARKVEGKLLDYRDFEPPADEAPKPKDRPQHGAGAANGADPKLKAFAAKCGKTFKIASALKARGVAPLLEDRQSGGTFIECPFEEHHSGPSPQRTYVVDGDGTSGFVIYCSGGHCKINGKPRDRLEQLQKMLNDGWLLWEDLENPDFGGVEVGSSRKLFVTVEAEEPLQQAIKCVDRLLQINSVEPRLFSRAGEVCSLKVDRATERVSIARVSSKDIRSHVEANVTFVKMKVGEEPTRYIPTPPAIAEHVLRLIEPRLPLLERIVDTPFFYGEGHLVKDPGYHEASHTYYAPPKDFVLPDVPMAPTADELQQAVATLLAPLEEFPFKDANDVEGGEVSRAHIVAAVVQLFVRSMIKGGTPALLIQKPSAGTGASLLADVISLIGFGRPASMETEKNTPEEWRKSITATLLAGASMMVFDNIHGEIKDKSIASSMTAEMWSDRLLGTNERLEIPNTGLWLFTGNNVTYSPEIARRLTLSRLDTGLVDPAQGRSFKRGRLKEWVKANREQLVHAVLVIVQAWVAAGKPLPPAGMPLGSFEGWQDTVGGILHHAGIGGFLGDRQVIKQGVSDEADAIQDFIAAMYRQFGTGAVRLGLVGYFDQPSAPPDTLCQLVLQLSDQLPFWWIAEKREKWGNRLGRELSARVDQPFLIRDGDVVTTVKLRKRKTERGMSYALEFVKRQGATPYHESCEDVVDDDVDVNEPAGHSPPGGCDSVGGEAPTVH